MKRVLFLNIVALVLTSGAQRAETAEERFSPNASLCQSKDHSLLKGIVYDNFVNTHASKQYPFTLAYQKADTAFSNALSDGCKTDAYSDEIVHQAESSCVKSCDATATGMFEGSFFGIGAKSKEKVFFNECVVTCKDSAKALQFYLLGASSK